MKIKSNNKRNKIKIQKNKTKITKENNQKIQLKKEVYFQGL